MAAWYNQKFSDQLQECCSNDDVKAFERCVVQEQRSDYTALLLPALRHDAAEIAEHCLQKGGTWNEIIWGAMASGNAEKVHRVFVKHGLDINQPIEIHGDALSAAVSHGNLSWARFCLDKGADPSRAMHDEYRSNLAEAAGNADFPMVELLLERGARREGSGALVYSAEEGKAESIEFLLKKGFDLNERAGMWWAPEEAGTALHKAIEEHPELVGLLLKTDMTVKDGQGRTPLELAKQLGKPEIVKQLEGL